MNGRDQISDEPTDALEDTNKLDKSEIMASENTVSQYNPNSDMRSNIGSQYQKVHKVDMVSDDNASL